MRTLLVLTTANQIEYTRRAIQSLQGCALQAVDVLVIDDCSDDGTREFVRSRALPVLTKAAPKGLTDSWNMGYREFIRSEYDALLLANNDIVVPRSAIDRLVDQLQTHMIVGAMSTLKGVGHQPKQSVRFIHQQLPMDETEPCNIQLVQDYVNGSTIEEEVLQIPHVNGFFFGINRDIRAFERGDGNLFDPIMTNIGNEDELCRRLGAEPKYVCTRSFVYHFKGITLDLARTDRARRGGGRNLLWTAARRLLEDGIEPSEGD